MNPDRSEDPVAPLEESAIAVPQPAVEETPRSVVLARGLARVTDRAVRIHIPKLPPDQRIEDDELRQAFMADYPSLFGALLDAFVMALNAIDTVKLVKKPRMLSYSTLGEALGKALGWERSFNDQPLW